MDAKTVNKETEEDVTDREDLRCGYFTWRPECLQKLNRPPWLLVSVMLMAFTQGFVSNGVVNVNMTTLERRFLLTSKQVAWIASSYDIGGGVFALTFGYLGTFVHKGRIIALSAFCMGIGSFLWTLPHFLAGKYEAGARPTDLCDTQGNVSECGPEESYSQNYYPLFIFSQLFMSVGGAAVYTLSVPMLDESVQRKNSAMYIGLLMSCSVLGPGMGFIVGGIFLQFYVDTGRVDMDDITITPTDPRWVGAWWIGFVYSGFASLVVAAVVACFPRELPSARQYKAERVSEAYAGRGEAESSASQFGRHPKDLLLSLKILATNPTYICGIIAGIVEYGLVLGFAVFLPKIIQFQFGQSATMAAIIAGVVVVPAATFGHILGGLIPRWLNLRVRGLIIQALICNGLTVVLAFQVLLKCDMPNIAGINVDYSNSTIELDPDHPAMYHPCNDNCSCSLASYDPICGQNDVTYFTPCHAGCLNSTGSGSDEVYYNCSCIAMESSPDPVYPDAVAGICAVECSILPLFMVLFFLLNLFTFIPLTAGSATTMRIIPDNMRSFAYGVSSTLVRYLGNVPGPLLLGLIFDNSCWLWQYTCREKGSCWIYKVEEVATGLLILGLTFKTISFIVTLMSLILYKPPPPKVDTEHIDMNTAENTKDTITNDKNTVESTKNAADDNKDTAEDTDAGVTMSNDKNHKSQNFMNSAFIDDSEGSISTHL